MIRGLKARKTQLDILNDVYKGFYMDTSNNRKIGRVGQGYDGDAGDAGDKKMAKVSLSEETMDKATYEVTGIGPGGKETPIKSGKLKDVGKEEKTSLSKGDLSKDFSTGENVELNSSHVNKKTNLKEFEGKALEITKIDSENGMVWLLTDRGTTIIEPLSSIKKTNKEKTEREPSEGEIEANRIASKFADIEFSDIEGEEYSLPYGRGDDSEKFKIVGTNKDGLSFMSEDRIIYTPNYNSKRRGGSYNKYKEIVEGTKSSLADLKKGEEGGDKKPFPGTKASDIEGTGMRWITARGRKILLDEGGNVQAGGKGMVDGKNIEKVSGEEEKVGVEKNNWNKEEAFAYGSGYDPGNESSMKEFRASDDAKEFANSSNSDSPASKEESSDSSISTDTLSRILSIGEWRAGEMEKVDNNAVDQLKDFANNVVKEKFPSDEKNASPQYMGAFLVNSYNSQKMESNIRGVVDSVKQGHSFEEYWKANDKQKDLVKDSKFAQDPQAPNLSSEEMKEYRNKMKEGAELSYNTLKTELSKGKEGEYKKTEPSEKGENGYNLAEMKELTESTYKKDISNQVEMLSQLSDKQLDALTSELKGNIAETYMTYSLPGRIEDAKKMRDGKNKKPKPKS